MRWDTSSLTSLLDDAIQQGASSVLAALGVTPALRAGLRVHLLFDDCSPEEGIDYATGLWNAGHASEALEVLEAVLHTCLGLTHVSTRASTAARTSRTPQTWSTPAWSGAFN